MIPMVDMNTTTGTTAMTTASIPGTNTTMASTPGTNTTTSTTITPSTPAVLQTQQLPLQQHKPQPLQQQPPQPQNRLSTMALPTRTSGSNGVTSGLQILRTEPLVFLRMPTFKTPGKL